MESQETEFGWLERFGVRVEEFRGEGHLKVSDELVVPCAFACVYLEDGRILAECHLAEGMLPLVGSLQTGATSVDLEGQTMDGLRILAGHATIGTWELTMGQDKPSRVLLEGVEKRAMEV